MAAIGANRLGVVVTHDSRTTELVNTMAIPHVDGSILRESPPSTADVLQRIVFAPDAFDRKRSEIASRYIDVFTALGVTLDAYVHAIAGLRDVSVGYQADQPDGMPAK